MNDTLKHLENIIASRLQQEDSQKSYVAQLHSKGLDSILKKIGEESAEVIIAAKNNNDKEALIYESCDLIFHLMVLLGHKSIKMSEIETELNRRLNISGLAEKASRNQ